VTYSIVVVEKQKLLAEIFAKIGSYQNFSFLFSQQHECWEAILSGETFLY